MEETGNKDTAASNRDLVLTRVFDAPRSRVFKAWTEPELLAKWWGPHGFTNPVCKLDVRPGGAIHIDMRAPDGTVYPVAGAFQEIAEPERLVFTSAALDGEGRPLLEGVNTATFTEHSGPSSVRGPQSGGKTALTLQVRIVKLTPEAVPMLKGMKTGWTQSLERLAEDVIKGS